MSFASLPSLQLDVPSLRTSDLISFGWVHLLPTMAYSDNFLHQSPPCSPLHSHASSPCGSRQDVPQDRESEADENPPPPATETLPPLTFPSLPPQSVSSTLPECPLEEWIKSHACWRSNVSFTRTEETPAGASSQSNSYLANIEPLVGIIFPEVTFIQNLGFQSELHARKSCVVCQKLYQHFKSHWISNTIQDVGDGSEVSCNIYRMRNERWYYRQYVSTSTDQ
jgi:hypothetical protein